MTTESASAQSLELCNRSLVWDAHAGVFPEPGNDLNLLDNWRDNGVNYMSINVGFDVMDWRQTLATLAAYRRWVTQHEERFLLAGTMEDIQRAKSDTRLALSFDIEGMNALNGDINMVSVYHTLGVRQMLFAYNLNNAAAGGCHDTDTGLSDFGREIVREMNRVGMIVDCSHAGYRTTLDIMEESRMPVVFSHSNPTTVWQHQRNIRDEQIKACAETGGVVGLNGMGIFLGENDISKNTLIQHLCYLCELIGPEHVGLGFDYSPDLDVDVGTILQSRPDFWPAGQCYDTPNIKHAGPSQIPEIVDGLFECGFKENEIRGILGENFQRVASMVWAR